jgi:hypothetical protein
MVARSDQGQTWDDVELPYVVRYRKNGFAVHFAFSAALFLVGGICILVFGSLVAGLPCGVLGVAVLVMTIVPMLHVREIDHMRIDLDALTLVVKDGDTVRIPFAPGMEFSVAYDQCCRSIVMASGGGDEDRQHLVADMLDVPRGQTIYGLCQLMNDLSSGRRGAVGPGLRRSSVQRHEDWYREPARISRLMFLAGVLGVGALFLCILFALTLVTASIDHLVAKPVFHAVRIGLSLLFVYPALRFLTVARLRDLGESAHHRNAAGLLWNFSMGGPLRVFLRRGQEGRNEFGPEPRF